MKTVLIIIISFFTSTIFAQSTGDAKVDSLIKQIKKQDKSKGTMRLVGKGAQVNDAATIIKTPQGFYNVGSSWSQATNPSNAFLCVSTITNGKQALLKDARGKRQSVVVINGTAYDVDGEITFTIKGKTASAIFTGTLYEVKKKGKSNDTSSGPITITFKNLLMP
jgi:hypothetical protein